MAARVTFLIGRLHPMSAQHRLWKSPHCGGACQTGRGKITSFGRVAKVTLRWTYRSALVWLVAEPFPLE
jgi:hypothetical protein